MLKQIAEWANKNPGVAGGGTAAVVSIIGVSLFFSQHLGGSKADLTGTARPDQIAALPGSGTPLTLGMAAPGGAQVPGSSDADALTKWTSMPAPSGRSNPMQPLWTLQDHGTADPGPVKGRTPSGDQPGADIGPDFTPPTPPTPVLSSQFWNYYHTTQAVAPLAAPAVPGARAESTTEAPATDRMAGVMYGGGKISALLERRTGNEPAASYIVRPGDRVGNDTVMAISPGLVTLQHDDGTTEAVTMRAGSPGNIPPAN